MSNPKVSICIPTYNQPDFLKLVLDSIVIQDFNDYEVIISDDSTNRESGALVETFKSSIPNLKYVKNEPSKKSPGSWNEAIRHAKGQLIKVMHSDDWFSDSKALGKFVQIMDSNPDCDFAFSAANVCDTAQKIKFIHVASPRELEELKKSPSFLFGRNIVGAPSATIYRSSIHHKYFDPKTKWVVDLDQYIDILEDNPNFAYSKEPLVCTTDGATHQSIHGSVGKKEVELFEWLYLYSKIRVDEPKMPHWVYMNLYIIFVLERCRVSNMDQIKDIPMEPEERNLVSKLLKFRFLFFIFKIRRYFIGLKNA